MPEKPVTLVYYANPSLVPAGLQTVGIVEGTAPDRVRLVSPVLAATPDLALADRVSYGAVRYANRSLVPDRILALGLGDYLARVLSLSPIAYWPMWERTGTVAMDLSGNSRDGAYTGVTLGQAGIGDGRTCPSFDGSTSFCNAYSASLAGAFNGAEGTLMCWAKVSAAGVWTDGTADWIFSLIVNGNNFVDLFKTAGGNTLAWRYFAAAVQENIIIGGYSQTVFMAIALTWSKTAEKVIAYVDGVEAGNSATLGVWAGVPATVVFGAVDIVPNSVWSGLIAHCALWDRALTPAEIASLALI